MEEEFYATLKLVSGEELLSKVSYLPDDDVLLLDRPLLVEPASQKKGKIEVNGFFLREWITATFDQMFVLPKKHVITMTEVEDRIIKFYNISLEKINGSYIENKKTHKLPKSSGYLGSIKETKKVLEELYKKS